MEENITETSSQTDETIEETVSDTDTPVNENTDNVEDPAVDDTTSSNDVAEDNFLLTFKTKEDAEKSFKSAQTKITEQGNKIKELEKQLNKPTDPVSDVKEEIAKVQQKIGEEYNDRLRGLGVKYANFIPNDTEIRTVDDIINNLPPADASKFTMEFLNLQNEYNNKLKQDVNNIYKNANSKFEEIKAKDKEKYKDNELIFNAWYNPPQTIEGVAELFETVKKQAIESYIKEQAAQQEDSTHKDKLNTAAASSTKKYGADHIFTRQELSNMSAEDFAKNEKIIDQQIAKGLVK
jgi:hypothetical protein